MVCLPTASATTKANLSAAEDEGSAEDATAAEASHGDSEAAAEAMAGAVGGSVAGHGGGDDVDAGAGGVNATRLRKPPDEGLNVGVIKTRWGRVCCAASLGKPGRGLYGDGIFGQNHSMAH